jgi:hypothetical protein
MIALVGLAVCAIQLILWRNYNNDPVRLAFTVLMALANILVLCGDRARCPIFFVPFLLMNVGNFNFLVFIKY